MSSFWFEGLVREDFVHLLETGSLMCRVLFFIEKKEKKSQGY